MPWGIAAGVVGSVAGSAISSAMAPSTSGGGSSLYTPTGLGSADQSWQALMQQQQQAYNGGNTGQLGANYQNAANTAGQQYFNLSNLSDTYGAALNAQGQNAYGAQNYLQQAGQQVFNQATDPNQAGYNLALTNLNSQTNAQQALRGLGNSAQGASEIANTDANFGINWNTQQVNNSIAGLGALGSAYNTAGSYGQLGNSDLSQAAGYYGAAPGYTLQGGSTPYNAATQMTNNALGQAQGIQNQNLNYLQYGQGVQSTAYNAANQNAQNMGATAAQGLGSLGQNLGSYFGSSGSGSGSSSSLFGASGDMSGLAGSYGSTSDLGSAGNLGYVGSAFSY